LLTQKYEVIAVLHLSEIVCPRANERHWGLPTVSWEFLFRKFWFAPSSRHVQCLLRRYFLSRSLHQLVHRATGVFLRRSEGSLLCNKSVFCENCFHRWWKNWLRANRGLDHVAGKAVSTFPT
jgi:hypothetical protein